MGGKDHPTATESPKVEVGEIDTRAPFASVKAAVSLFSEGAITDELTAMKKPKSIPTERVLAKETKLHMAYNELQKFKEQLKNAETAKTHTLSELARAKKKVEDLTHKLGTVNESKESAIKATEAAKNQAKKLEEANSGNPSEYGGAWKVELEGARQQYATYVTELNTAKQVLQKIRLDFEASMDEKAAVLQQAVDAEHATMVNKERADELSKEIASVQQSLVYVKLASEQAQQERAEILSEKNAQQQASIVALHEMQKKSELLKKEFDPEVVGILEEKLAETDSEIASLQNEVENARDSMKAVTTELYTAKIELQKLAEEESSLITSVESLKQELERVKKEHTELKEKEVVDKNVERDLHIELQKSKAELDWALAGENKARTAVDELTSTLQKLSFESINARTEVETLNKDTEGLQKEAETTLAALKETERKLLVAQKEAEEANQLRMLSEKTKVERESTSETDAQVMISAEEYKSLNRKVEESSTLAEMKVAAAEAEVEAVRANESKALKRLEAAQKEIEEMEVSTKEALNKAEMAEAAKQAVEGEIRRWREREQKRAAEAATHIPSDTEISKEPPTLLKWNPSEKVPPSPSKLRFFKTNSAGKVDGSRKMGKSSTRKSLLSDLSGIFRRKKSLSEGGSPSYLPGEKPL